LTLKELVHISSGTIEIKDLKVALRALGIEPAKNEIKELISKIRAEKEKETENQSVIEFQEFLQIMETKMAQKETPEEIEAAYKLFEDKTAGCITEASLMEVAKRLEDNMSSEEIREMLAAAASDGHNNSSVTKKDFENIIRKATNQ